MISLKNISQYQTFISKVIENVISVRLNELLIKHSMFDSLQSAYREKHSAETDLIKVQNGILSELDVASFLMLDLSAVFDTIYKIYIIVTIM